ncbi:MAG: cell division protein ZipA [Gammaproteobacteria bacterium]|nr:cell division protein ZipA [Gammaproteobacteria bacterium]MDH5652200.1 cell division protein ZipA [Gammaproteobacteria bacterium]
MDTLRLTLLIIGLVFIAGLYFYYRDPDERPRIKREPRPSLIARFAALFKRQEAPQGDEDEAWIRPKITEEDFEQLGPIVARRAGDADGMPDEEIHIDWDSTTPVAPGDELVLVFHIMAGNNRWFTGDILADSLVQAGLVFGEKNIYHFYGTQLTAEGDAICSLANTVEPGWFDPDKFSEFTTPGVTLFMQLPGPIEARRAFETTLDKAGEIAELLDGELRDESRNRLTEQTIGHLREKVEAFRFKQQIAAIKQRRQER